MAKTKEQNAAYYAAHAEQRKAYQRAYNEANRERLSEQRKERYRTDAAYRDARRAASKASRLKDPEAYRAKQRAYGEANRESRRAKERLRKYEQMGVTPEWYEERLTRQGGVCAICRLPEGESRNSVLSVDHDHATGAPRGLLCGKCNRALGLLGDTLTGVEAAAAYLRA